jgi:Tol biopolymer transport system component
MKESLMKLFPCPIPNLGATRARDLMALCLLIAVPLVHGKVLAGGSTPPTLPPSGAKIVFVSARDGNPEIYTVNLDGTGLARLTNHPAVDEFPTWSPDGNHVAFQSNRTGSSEIYVMDADGSNVAQRTFSASLSEHPTWSPDGTTIAYSTLSNGSNNIWKVGAFSGAPSLLFSAPGWDAHPDWSPDGARLALSSDWYFYDFVYDIFLVNTDGSELSGRTDDVFDHVDYVQPAWSTDGSRLSLTIVQTTEEGGLITNLGVMDADGSHLRSLAPAAPWTRSSWSPDGQLIVYTSPSKDVAWTNADGSASGTIIANGWDADWGPLSITSVETSRPERLVRVRVLTSPSRGPVRFAVERQDPGDELDIYDVIGRHVGHVPLGTSLTQVVAWEWRQSGHGAGVYFARLGRGTQSVRFVVLR